MSIFCTKEELMQEMFCDRMVEVILSYPLKWMQMTPTAEDGIFFIEGIRKDDFNIQLITFEPDLEGHMDLYREFKRHYLSLNKIKFGDLCHFEISHLR
jgi:hypothetical protein